MTEDSSDPTPQSWLKRRGLLLGGAAVATGAWWGWPKVAPFFVGEFDFEPLAELPGFRRIAAGNTTSGMNPFVGLRGAADEQAAAEAAMRRVRADVCGALFHGRGTATAVPVASFSDYNCPFCKVLTLKLAQLQEAGEIDVAWHEWPLLGEASMQAARAALAADAQGAYAAFHKRLMRSRFRPAPAYLREIARSLDIDADQMLSDMSSPAVIRRLEDTDALSRLFGFPGTPALIVGRTVVVGAVSDATLAALIAQERRDGPISACQV